MKSEINKDIRLLNESITNKKYEKALTLGLQVLRIFYAENSIIDLKQIDRFFFLREINDILNKQIDINYSLENYLDIINILYLIFKLNEEILTELVGRKGLELLIEQKDKTKSSGIINWLSEVWQSIKDMLASEDFNALNELRKKAYKQEVDLMICETL